MFRDQRQILKHFPVFPLFHQSNFPFPAQFSAVRIPLLPFLVTLSHRGKLTATSGFCLGWKDNWTSFDPPSPKSLNGREAPRKAPSGN